MAESAAALGSAPKRSKFSYKLCSHCNKELTIKKYREHKSFFFQEETQMWFKELDESDDGSITIEMTSLDNFEVDSDSAKGIISFPERNSPVYSESTSSKDTSFEDPLDNDHENEPTYAQGSL